MCTSPVIPSISVVRITYITAVTMGVDVITGSAFGDELIEQCQEYADEQLVVNLRLPHWDYRNRLFFTSHAFLLSLIRGLPSASH
jgi:hypothetical protein